MDMPLGLVLLIIPLVSFILTYIAVPPLIRKLKNSGFVAHDMNKPGKPKVVKLGGVAVFLGVIVAFLLPLQLAANSIATTALLGAALSISLIAFLGFVDDVLNIPQLYRVILPLFAALPLMLLKLGVSEIALPFVGTVNLHFGYITLPIIGTIGLNLYVLVLIPIGVIACSNLVNLLAGFNGLEAGTGIIIAIFMIIILIMTGFNQEKIVAIFLMISLLGALSAFIMFNWYPAKVFPGNIVTYLIGVCVAVAVIIGNVEKAGAILMMPQIVEFFLKALSRFKAQNFGKCMGKRLYYEGEVRSITHIVMKLFRPTETQLVLIICGLQVLAGIMAILSILVGL
ncbi:MAG: hypothetical protein ACP5H8_01475 [Candidatus Micrarchaeia archaeon]